MFKPISTGLENYFIPKNALEFRSCLGLDLIDYDLRVRQATTTRTTTWTSGQTLTAANLNTEFNNLLNALALGDSDVSGGIAASKISGTAVTLSGAQTVSGTKTFSAVQNLNGGWSSTGQPMVRVYRTGTQSINNTTTTKLQMNTETYDILGEFDSSSNYRYTATVSGYYLVNFAAEVTLAAAGDIFIISIYLNGSVISQVTTTIDNARGNEISAAVSDIIQLNGSSDYIEFYVYQNSGAARNISTGSTKTFGSIVKLF